MTTFTLTPSIDAELPLEIQLGPQIIALRPTPRSQLGPRWVPLAEDSDIGIAGDAPCDLRLRLLAYDSAGEPIATPPWIVRASTRASGGSWQSLPDLSSDPGDYLTAAHEVALLPRTYRFTIGLQGTALATTFELAIGQVDPDTTAADDDHDVIFDPVDDLKPKPKPTGSSTGSTAIARLTASG